MTMTLPTIYQIAEKANNLRLDLGGLMIWYSYLTPVAFETSTTRVVRQNDWGPTTGKHLNAIDGGGEDAKKSRVSSDVFEKALDQALKGGSND
jgi:hypothetical protein